MKERKKKRKKEKKKDRVPAANIAEYYLGLNFLPGSNSGKYLIKTESLESGSKVGLESFFLG